MKSKFYLDPTNITKYDCTTFELELRILWWILAAGKNGVTSAQCLEKLLCFWYNPADLVCTPFEIISSLITWNKLANELKIFGIGCFNIKTNYFRNLINAKLNLHTCSVDDLENINGIGPKTARCFLIHSRSNQQFAGLDRHILSYLKDLGYTTTTNTPTSKKYKILEKQFLDIVANSGKSAAELDLLIWNVYSGRDKDLKSLSFLNGLKHVECNAKN